MAIAITLVAAQLELPELLQQIAFLMNITIKAQLLLNTKIVAKSLAS